MTQWQEEWSAIVAQRARDEASGEREPHVAIREHFARFVWLTYAAAVVFGAFVVLLIV